MYLVSLNFLHFQILEFVALWRDLKYENDKTHKVSQ